MPGPALRGARVVQALPASGSPGDVVRLGGVDYVWLIPVGWVQAEVFFLTSRRCEHLSSAASLDLTGEKRNIDVYIDDSSLGDIQLPKISRLGQEITVHLLAAGSSAIVRAFNTAPTDDAIEGAARQESVVATTISRSSPLDYPLLLLSATWRSGTSAGLNGRWYIASHAVTANAT